MRAHWVRNLAEQDDYTLVEDSLHHLVNVVRIKVGEELLLLNGCGQQVLTEVQEISKRELRLKKISQKIIDRNYIFDLVLAMPKKDALDLSLKEATELGFRNIYLVRSAYSQMKCPEADRLEKILVSALEQSNAPYLPSCQGPQWTTVPWDQYENIILLDSQGTFREKNLELSSSPQALIVGPEGGFSPEELEYLRSLPSSKIVNLPTPIMRTPTALAVGAGVMLQSLRK